MKAATEEIRVRRMSAADVDRVLMIAGSRKDAPQWTKPAYLSALQPNAAPRRISLVAEDAGARDGSMKGGRVVGFLIASLVPPQAELESIAVSASDEGRGIGRMLFSATVEELRAAAASEFMLEVRASNRRALEFYRSLGWMETGRRPRYYADPEEDAVLMSLALG